MASLSPKDRVSLCSFTFADGRRCRSPRFGNHPRFCPDHAQKEARARARQSLGKDLAHYFSGNYLSACDLSTALGCLIPAVVRGDIKPKVARTVAYMAQTLLQSIQISQHEYINAFDTGDWRKSIRKSVNGNYNYRFPPAPKPEQPPETRINCHSERSEEPPFSSSPAPPQTQAPQPAPSPHTPLPPASAEFAQHVLAGLQTGGAQAPQPATASSPTSASPQTPVSQTAPPSTAFHPERSEGSQLNHPTATTDKSQPTGATQPAQPTASTPQPACPEQDRRGNPPPRPSAGSSRDTPWWDSRHLYDSPDSHLL